MRHATRWDLFLVAVALSAAQGGCLSNSTELGTELELVECWPVETSLDDPGLREAGDVWVEMIDGAERELDLAWFYGSSRPGTEAEGVLDAIERAAGRGVRVRVLFDKMFREIMPEVPDRLAANRAVLVRILDLGPLTGGVLHAKYFLVDDREAFVGSQNLDWRSLEHIAELGVRVRAPRTVAALARTFELDWALAGKEAAPPAEGPEPGPERVLYRGEVVRVEAVASPRALLPPGVPWDLPAILERIERARERVRLQFLTYEVALRDGTEFLDLERALRAAADRGVEVEMILADWAKDPARIERIQELERHPRITIRLVTIPEWSRGFVPYSRVVHRKFVVVDSRETWIGTSNAGGDYFHASRNVGLLVTGEAFAQDVERVFVRLWRSPYAATVDPRAVYREPRYRE